MIRIEIEVRSVHTSSTSLEGLPRSIYLAPPLLVPFGPLLPSWSIKVLSLTSFPFHADSHQNLYELCERIFSSIKGEETSRDYDDIHLITNTYELQMRNEIQI